MGGYVYNTDLIYRSQRIINKSCTNDFVCRYVEKFYTKIINLIGRVNHDIFNSTYLYLTYKLKQCNESDFVNIFLSKYKALKDASERSKKSTPVINKEFEELTFIADEETDENREEQEEKQFNTICDAIFKETDKKAKSANNSVKR